MAGDWIKMRKSLPSDPKLVRIMSALNADRFRTLGGILSAWCLLDDQTECGNLDGYTPEVFDAFVGFPGLCQAMIDVGWMRQTAQGLEAVNFTEHNGQTAKRRAQENVRKMSARNADKLRTKCGPEKRIEEKSNKKEKLGDEPISSFLANADFRDRWETYKEVSESRHNWTIGGMQEQTALAEIERDCKTVEVALGILDATIAAGSKHPHRVSAKRQPAMAGTSRRTNLD